ncbi:hypothetical protein NDU88_006485 [Pleurodeles waltl]|uniref:Uncharacterized protein n=1 Tax=Pleurodeles waltl TaxID=8319 RepID=A0AAV7VQV1_PLEWA|nr:hypothetical protein NDU88_006485 [Pleurodeles waltl]
MITCYLTEGLQENSSEHIAPLLADNQSALKENHVKISGEKACSEGYRGILNEKDSLLTMMQGSDVEPLGIWGGREHPKLLNNKEVNTPLSKNTQPGFGELESYANVQVSQGEAATLPVGDEGDPSHMVQSFEAGAKETGARKQALDWSKDGGDKFYSLTEDSDTTSSGHNLSETGGSISSESGSISSTAESTVRQQWRQWKGLKTRASIRDGAELSAQSSNTLKWDYSGTNLTGTVKLHTSEAHAKADKGADVRACCPDLSIGTINTDSEMLESIYDSIKELQTETRVESCRARMATKRLQGIARKVVKSCIEIEEKLSTMEERTMAVEADVEALREQSVAHDGQLTDIMWKLEDEENRQRRNTLRFLGIGEGVEGNDADCLSRLCPDTGKDDEIIEGGCFADIAADEEMKVFFVTEGAISEPVWVDELLKDATLQKVLSNIVNDTSPEVTAQDAQINPGVTVMRNPSETRPKRKVSKPSWFKDYVK